MTSERARALEISQGLKPSPKNIERVGQDVGAEAARWAFTQWELRARAKTKFSRAEEMVFDREGLEMASHEDLASGVHALGFPSGERVADLTVGIGSDLIGLSLGHDTVGFETDSERADSARHNLEVYGRKSTLQTADCLSAEWDFDYAFADPARRSGGRRTLDPAQFTPRLDLLVPRMEKLKLGRIKLSPMLTDEFLEEIGSNRVFVSHDGECKEVLVHVGRDCENDKHTSGVWSLIVESGTWLRGEVPLTDIRDAPLGYVFEADPAVIRSHGLGNYGMAGLGESNGYLTADEPRQGWRKAYRTLWHGPFHIKDIKRAIAEAGFKVDNVKSRGVDVDVRRVRKQLESPAGKSGTLLLYREGKSINAVLSEDLRPVPAFLKKTESPTDNPTGPHQPR